MATFDNLTNIEEYQKTSFPFSNDPLNGSSIYGKMKENKPIILPTTYEDSNGKIEDQTIFETIYYNNNDDNKINTSYQNKDTVVFDKDDFSSSLTVTVYNTNENITSDQLETTSRKFYNNVMSNSNISYEISEENNYNNIINNKNIEIGENLNIDNIIYNKFPTTEDQINYTNLLDNKTDTFTDNLNNKLIFGNENILNTNIDELNNFNTNKYSKNSNNPYKDISYEVDSKNENISYQINIITNDGQSMEYDNISNLMKTEEIKPKQDINPFEYNPQKEYNNNNENIFKEKNIEEDKTEYKEENKEEKKAIINEVKEDAKMEEKKEEHKEEERKENKEEKKEKKKEKKENEKDKVKKRSVGTQTDEDNIKCIYNYTSRKIYKSRKKSFDKYNNKNDYYYRTNYRDYRKGKLFPVYDFNTYDAKNYKKKDHSKRKKNINVFFNPIRKIRIHKHGNQDKNYFQTNNNAYDNYFQTNSYLFDIGNNNLSPTYNLQKNKSEIFNNNFNINDNQDNNYNFEYDLTNNNEQIGNDIIINQNYDNININTEIYGENYNYENITNEIIDDGSGEKKIFNMFQNNNNDNLNFYDDNYNYHENYVENNDNNYDV